MSEVIISDAVKYIGADDKSIDLFESQYIVPNGVSYNSYVILDEKTAVMDMVDRRAEKEWFENLAQVLGGRKPDYLVVSHLEPDHAANIGKFLEVYPSAKIVGNAKTFQMLPNYFDVDIEPRKVLVKEGDTLNLGTHTLTFIMAPMVHWPEVMVEYESTEKILFSADGFGKFGTLDTDEAWADEARRYYINIVGKYGVQVQNLLKKAKSLEIEKICPLHGPILTENLGYYLDLYDKWSSYTPEESGTVVAYASIHGNTAAAVKEFVKMLEAKGEKTVVYDLARADMAQVISDAYRYDKLVTASVTYDGGIFPCMHDFLAHLKAKNFQKRTVGLIENGSWAPAANKIMKAAFEELKDITVLEPLVTMKGTLQEVAKKQLEALAEAVIK